MRSIRGWLQKMIAQEVHRQLNVIFYGRNKGPTQVGQTPVLHRRKDKPKAIGLGNIHPSA